MPRHALHWPTEVRLAAEGGEAAQQLEEKGTKGREARARRRAQSDFEAEQLSLGLGAHKLSRGRGQGLKSPAHLHRS